METTRDYGDYTRYILGFYWGYRGIMKNVLSTMIQQSLHASRVKGFARQQKRIRVGKWQQYVGNVLQRILT